MIVERDFVVEKLKRLVSSKQRVNAVDTKRTLSLNRQLQLLSVSKTAYYFKGFNFQPNHLRHHSPLHSEHKCLFE